MTKEFKETKTSRQLGEIYKEIKEMLMASLEKFKTTEQPESKENFNTWKTAVEFN